MLMISSPDLCEGWWGGWQTLAKSLRRPQTNGRSVHLAGSLGGGSLNGSGAGRLWVFCGDLVVRGRGLRHGNPSLPAVCAGERAGRCYEIEWSGAGSNRRPSAFQGFRRPLDHDLITIVTTQLTGIGAGQWAYTAIIATVPPCAV
jgi:hypothetical protein